MKIRFHKGKGKPNTLTCLRDDGTCSRTPLNLPVLHDITHYVVETTLGCRKAFYGLVASGWAIEDFGAIDAATGKKRILPTEAGYAECIVGLLQAEMLHISPPEDFYTLLEITFEGFCLSPPTITPEQLAAMREAINRLYGQWQALPPDATLELAFAVTNPAGTAST